MYFRTKQHLSANCNCGFTNGEIIPESALQIWIFNSVFFSPSSLFAKFSTKPLTKQLSQIFHSLILEIYYLQILRYILYLKGQINIFTPSEDCPNSLHSIFSTEENKKPFGSKLSWLSLRSMPMKSTQYEQQKLVKIKENILYYKSALRGSLKGILLSI